MLLSSMSILRDKSKDFGICYVTYDPFVAYCEFRDPHTFNTSDFPVSLLHRPELSRKSMNISQHKRKFENENETPFCVL